MKNNGKCLPSKIIAVLISILFLLNTGLAYTVTIIIDGARLQVTRDPGEVVEVLPKLEEIKGWEVESGDVTIVENKFIMPSNDVTIEAIYTQSKYILTVENFGVSGSTLKEVGSEVTVTATSNENYIFTGWSAEGVVLENPTNATITFIMPENNVTLIANYEECISLASIPVGSYIAYTPSITSYTVPTTASGYESAQTYNPSTYNEGWKVFKNNSGQIDIISAESIGNLTLKGATGYAKAVKTLNELCEAYTNPIYATSGRSLGEGGAIGEINTTTYPLVGGVSGEPYIDGAYSSDKGIMDANTRLRHSNSSGCVWLASRYLETAINASNFWVRALDSIGSVSYNYSLYYVPSSGSAIDGLLTYGVRPVISLKSGIQIIGGSGTQADPYRITI